MKQLAYTLIISLLYYSLSSQQQVVLDNQVYIKLSNNANVVLDNPNANAIVVGSTGNIISENENNVLKWLIQNNSGNYVVPFATNSFSSIPLRLNIINSGVGSNGSIIFSTYETTTDKNTNYPSDVTNLNSNCRDSVGLFVVDRFWRIDAQNYTTKPTTEINFGYDNSVNEIGGLNSIIENNLKAMRFNSTTNSWETPQKLYGNANTILKQVSAVNVSSTDFHQSWTLVDSSIMSIPIMLSSVSNNSFCVGATATIVPSGATNYTLLPNNTTSSSVFTVMPSTSTVYTITGSVGTGTAVCTSNSINSPTLNIIAYQPPLVSSVVNSVSCYGDKTGSATAFVSSNATYTWSNGSHASIINGLLACTYSVLVMSDNGCVTNHTLQITEPNAPLSVLLSQQNVLCFGQSNGSVSAQANGGTPNYTYTWQPNSISSNSLTNLSAGNYSLYIQDANGCKTQSIIAVQEPLTQLQSLITDSVKPFCGDNNGELVVNTIGGVGQYSYMWQPTQTQSNYLQNVSAGNYTLFTTDINGCKDTLIVFLGCENPIKIPQLFSPNADGKNDFFTIDGLEKYNNNHLFIYNRWGNLVFEKQDYQNTWNGKAFVFGKEAKEVLPAATYFVVLEFEAGMKPYTGYVELRY